jgi:hypothetical protein
VWSKQTTGPHNRYCKCCLPLLPKIIGVAATSGAVRGALASRDGTGLTMLTAVMAIFVLLSIGTLIAHALDAFRSG